MEFLEFKNIFNDKLKENNLKEGYYKSFFEYMNLLLEWNEKVNLTAIKDEKEFIVKHFIDSLTISSYIDKDSKLIDIGSGAGFPGIPLKINDGTLGVTLVDSVNKKVNVLKDIINKLELKNIEALHFRAEELAFKDNYRESFDYAVSRAVANMSTLVEYLLPFVKVGGKAICMKGPNCEEELKVSQKAIEVLGGKVEQVVNLNISDNFERNIIIIKKIREISNKYPRQQGKPLKEPIK